MSFDVFISEFQGSWWQSLAALLLLLFASRGVGCWLLPKSHDEFIRFALGAAFLAWLYPWWLPGAVPKWIPTVLLLFPAARGAWKLPRWSIADHWPLCTAVGIFGAATLASAFLPPDAWDEQVYQTVLYAEFPAVCGASDNPYAAYPLLPQLLMQWVRPLGGSALPRLAVWALSLMLSGKLYLETSRRGGNALFGAVLTVCVMLSPLALTIHRSFYAEGFIALFLLAGMAASETPEGSDEDPRRQMMLAGIFAGACCAVKLTGVGAALVLMVSAFRRRRFGWFALAAALMAAPFFMRAALSFGTPFYPFGAKLFGEEKTVLVENIYRELGSYGGNNGAAGIAFGWLRACFDDGKTFDGVACGFGMLALIILTVWSVCRLRSKSAWVGFSALAAGYLFWALTSRQSRFLYPLLFPASLLLADGHAGARERVEKLAAVVLLATGTILSWTWIYPMLRHHFFAWRMVSDARRDPGRYLAWKSNDPAYFNSLKMLGTVPENSRVLLLFERRRLYVPRYCEQGSPLFQEVRLTPAPETADELWNGIRDFDHLLLGSGQGRVDHLDKYDPVERQVDELVVELVRRGRLRWMRPPAGVDAQPLFEVVHER